MCIVQLDIAENCLISLNVRNYRRNQICSSTVQGTHHSAIVKYIIIYHSADATTFDFFVAFFFMAALRSRCGIMFFVLFLSSFFSSPNVSSRRLDVYRTSTHDVVLVRI